MPEKCPLQVGRQYYDTEDDSFGMPDACLRQCESRWGKALESGDEESYDDFELRHHKGWDDEGVPCEHDVEYGGETLERLGDAASAKRGYGVISVCMLTGDEAFATQTTFDCPNN